MSPLDLESPLPFLARFRLIRRKWEHWGRNALMELLKWAIGPPSSLQEEISPLAEALEDRTMRKVRRIVVVRTGKALGDALMSLAMIPDLKRLFPGAKVDFLLRDNICPLFRGVSEIHALLEWRPKVWKHPITAFQFFRALRQNRYDVAMVSDNPFKTSFTTLCLALWSGARYRVGFDNEESRPFLNLPVVPLKEVHMVVNLRHLLTPLGTGNGGEGTGNTKDSRKSPLKGDKDAPAFVPPLAELRQDKKTQRIFPKFTPSSRAMREADRILDHTRPVIVFASGHWRKSWPIQFFVKIARELTNRKFPVFLSFGPGDARWEDSVVKEWTANSEGLGNALPPKDLEVFAALLPHCRLFMATDCGPYHLAAAMGTPCVGIFRTFEAQRDFGYEEPNRLATVYHPEEKEAGRLAVEKALKILGGNFS